MRDVALRVEGLACLLFVRAFNPAQDRVAWIVVVVDARAAQAEELAGLVAVRANVHGLRRAENVMDDARRDELEFVVAFTAAATVALFVVECSRGHSASLISGKDKVPVRI